MFFEIREICNQVYELNEFLDENGAYIFRPNILVLDEFKKVVIRAYTYIGKAPISAKVESDNKEGLTINWTMPIGTYVSYYVPAKGEPTLTYRFLETGGKELSPNHEILVKYLNNLK